MVGQRGPDGRSSRLADLILVAHQTIWRQTEEDLPSRERPNIRCLAEIADRATMTFVVGIQNLARVVARHLRASARGAWRDVFVDQEILTQLVRQPIAGAAIKTSLCAGTGLALPGIRSERRRRHLEAAGSSPAAGTRLHWRTGLWCTLTARFQTI